MTTQLWANEAGTTLAAAITSAATTLTVTNGSAFPAPAAGQAFQLTLTSSTNSSFQEIVSCTARSGTTLTVVRGQEGTTAQAFNAGDLAQNLITAGSLQSLANINGNNAQIFQSNYFLAEQGAVTGLANAATILFDFPFTNAANGSLGFPNKAIIQFGAIDAPANNTPTLYSYPEPFPNLCRVILISYGALVPPTAGAIGAQPIAGNKTQFYATNTSTKGGTNGCEFIAIGY